LYYLLQPLKYFIHKQRISSKKWRTLYYNTQWINLDDVIFDTFTNTHQH